MLQQVTKMSYLQTNISDLIIIMSILNIYLSIICVIERHLWWAGKQNLKHENWFFVLFFF